MNTDDLLPIVHREINRRAYLIRLEILDHSSNLLKARLFISPDLFIQVYRNDHFDTTNLVLIYNRQRIYARDKLGGVWHRHPMHEADTHDFSVEGQSEVSLTEFLDEVEILLAQLGLP